MHSSGRMGGPCPLHTLPAGTRGSGMSSEPDGTARTVPTNKPILLEDVRGEQPSHTRATREITANAQPVGYAADPVFQGNETLNALISRIHAHSRTPRPHARAGVRPLFQCRSLPPSHAPDMALGALGHRHGLRLRLPPEPADRRSFASCSSSGQVLVMTVLRHFRGNPHA